MGRERDARSGARVKGRTVIYVVVALAVLYFVWKEYSQAQAAALQQSSVPATATSSGGILSSLFGLANSTGATQSAESAISGAFSGQGGSTDDGSGSDYDYGDD